MNNEHEYLTKEKYEELKKELDFLRNEKRKEVAENLEYSKGLGDLSENAEYHEARETQVTVEDRIAKLESILKSAVIMSDQHGDTVKIGTTVVIKKEKSSTNDTYTLVGSEEVDVDSGKISIHSPLGSSLLGRRKNDEVTFDSPSGPTVYIIVDIK